MSTYVQNQYVKTFEALRKAPKKDEEFWYARELQEVLEYQTWRKFSPVIRKAINACQTAGYDPAHHFIQIKKKIKIMSKARRTIKDYKLSRYACYLIIQNGDPTKPLIANGQTYFALQARRQELENQQEAEDSLSEDQSRLMLRNELTAHNKNLAAIAKDRGVKTGADYSLFQNHGYKGLYGGLDNKAIHRRKGLKKSEKILDRMNSIELAANLFRATQTEEKLKREHVANKYQANQLHYNVGEKVRKTIEELGGTMPEDLPTPKKSIKQLEKQSKKLKIQALKRIN